MTLHLSPSHRLLKKEEEELKKINSGMGAVILKDLKEHAKYRKWKQQHIDPRNASRTPSASKEPMYRLRYESPIGASPSRQLDHQKPFYEDETMFDRSTSYRGSVGRSLGTAPSYNGNLFSNRFNFQSIVSHSIDFSQLEFIIFVLFSFRIFFLSSNFIFFIFLISFRLFDSAAIHSYRSTPKYGIKSSTLPSQIGYRNGYSSVSFLLLQTKYS